MHRSHLVGLEQGEGLLHAAEKSGEDRWNGFRGKARLEGNVEEFLATVKQTKRELQRILLERCDHDAP